MRMTSATMSASYDSPKLPFGFLTKFTYGVSDFHNTVEYKALVAFGQSDYITHKSFLLEKLNPFTTNDWDGEGAMAIEYMAIENCAAFLTRIDEIKTSITPELSLDPDGWISLEWYLNPKSLIEISFGSSDAASFSALVKGLPRFGEFSIFDKKISPSVLGIFKELDDVKRTASYSK